MATRQDLAVIKAARAGESTAQLALGSRYLYGGTGLPRSNGTAFYWLQRAARQGVDDAWMMIGRNISYDQVKDLSSPREAAVWYQKAFDAGVPAAGLTYARLVLDNTEQFDGNSHAKAIGALTMLASNDDHHAQWLLAQQMQKHARDAGAVDAAAGDNLKLIPTPGALSLEERLITEAAHAGIEQAQFALMDKAWNKGDYDAFVRDAAPLIAKLLERNANALAQVERDVEVTAAIVLSAEQATLLLRHAQWQLQGSAPDPVMIGRFLELAARAGNTESRLELGLLHAKINRAGERVFMEHGLANFKKALSWLTLAGEGGSALAWHALARIYSRSIYSQRNLNVAQQYLEKAADMGLVEAQFEFAQISWRNRRDDRLNDVRAMYWWQKAAGQGHQDAKAALEPFSVQASGHAWAIEAVAQMTDKMRNANPFLCARVELAATFGLSKPEALLIDVKNADYGHCMVIDICDYYARSKRRLVSIDTEAQRSTLNRIGRLFGDVDCSFSGLEGNYRQRQYRLKTSFPGIA
ncbi:tetratricopeptide repeat protein [Herbaspirillum sp. YR522]|uniref:tetratricopeptide repeat protein n=1 Tax=Herbaspirillum sp. YR522 TaxID=1144342 RepID=UPI00026F9999|nr:SEL1-like repeat protein [Herbaspirillum sp. YR522]EJN09016.1 Sel1 repeat protein [Herbaspirillum sp. YR522]